MLNRMDKEMTKGEKRNIIITGPPRSGTTLTCHLLNKLKDVVALHEPMNLRMFSSREEGLKNIPLFFNEMRELIQKEGKAISRVKDGKIPDNPFLSGSKMRKSIVKKEVFSLPNPPDLPDFTLAIKHNAHFSFLLEELVKDFECYAIIRNPLAVVASWNTIKAPVSEGNLKVLKGIDPQLEKKLWKIPDVIDRQIQLIDILFGHLNSLEERQIITYEDIIETGGQALYPISSAAFSLNEKLSNTNLKKRYPGELMEVIYKKLIQKNKASNNWRRFYSAGDFEEVMNTYL